MDIMKTYPDNYFDLAIVDPPYGIGFHCEKPSMVLNKHIKWGNKKLKGYTKKDWDKNAPKKEYFIELLRISKNQIIWGGNYFDLKPSGGWIVWDKIRPADFSLSQAELAWVSSSGRIAIYKYLWNGFQKQIPENRFHPTQKPIKLYEWIYKNYAKPEFKIIDTHLGSGSNAIAANRFNIAEFVGIEIDSEYFEKSIKRFETETLQMCLF